MQYVSYYDSPLGRMKMAAEKGKLCGLWFEGQKYYGASLTGSEEERDLPVFRDTSLWLDRYFRKEDPGRRPELLLKGSLFRIMVWNVLLGIPYGETMTYKEIAERICWISGKQHMSAQAVGGAVGHNPVSLIVPCHRVIGTDGSLTGYAGGIERKRYLLEMEKQLI